MNYKKLYTLPLLLSFLTTLSFAEGEPTNLKTWSLKENSVKIAFKNNRQESDALLVSIYSVHNEIEKHITTREVFTPPGEYGLRRITGLQPGTNYKAIVISQICNDVELFCDNNKPSEPLNFKTKGEDPSSNYGNPASNLKAWRVKETSVKISFKDHTYFEDSFKIIIRDEEGKEVASREVEASPIGEVGKTLIGKVSGLTAGTNYTAEVSSYVDVDEDFIGDKMNTSKKISFTTKGDTVQPPSDIGATDLRTWSIRNTSAMISFRNNDTDGSGSFEFINMDTGEPMTLNSKGIITVPNNENYLIGKMIDLTPETTYNIRISHDEMQESKVITFTTKP